MYIYLTLVIQASPYKTAYKIQFNLRPLVKQNIYHNQELIFKFLFKRSVLVLNISSFLYTELKS